MSKRPAPEQVERGLTDANWFVRQAWKNRTNKELTK